MDDGFRIDPLPVVFKQQRRATLPAALAREFDNLIKSEVETIPYPGLRSEACHSRWGIRTLHITVFVTCNGLFRESWRWGYVAYEWAAAELAALWRFEFLPASWREPFAFGLRAWFACMLALYLAFLFQIDEPFWAAVTVW